MMKRICFFGAGAVGSVLAARLARAGQAVSIVTRAAHARAVREHGLKLVEREGESVQRVEAVEHASDLGPQDLVVATLKAHSLPGAAADLARLAGGSPIAVVVNGIPWWYFHGLVEAPERELPRLDPDGELWRRIDPGQVIGGVVRLPAELLAPGVARGNGQGDSLLLGEPAGGVSPRLAEVAAWLQGACPRVAAVDDIRSAIWDKLLMNLPTSLMSTLTLSKSFELLRNPDLVDLYRRIVAEGEAVAFANGARPKVDVEAQIARAGSAVHPPSMLQDLLAGKPLEIDAQLRAVRELAHRKQVPIPLTDTLLRLLEQRIAPR